MERNVLIAFVAVAIPGMGRDRNDTHLTPIAVEL